MVVLKDILREIKARWSQFIAIIVITVLGVGFYIGIQVTGHNMRMTGDAYMQDAQVLDFQVRHSLGIDDAMLQDFEKIASSRVYGIYDVDAYLESKHFDDVVKVIELDANTRDDITLIEGRMPREEGEVLVDHMMKEMHQMKLGDSLKLKSNDLYPNQDLKIVAFVQSSLFMNLERGQTRLGTGGLSGFIYPYKPKRKNEEAVYTAARFVLEDNQKQEEVKTKIEKQEARLSQERLERLMKPHQEALEKAQETLNDETRKTEEKLAQEAQLLKQAKQQLTDSKQELTSALASLPVDLPEGDLLSQWAFAKETLNAELMEEEKLMNEAKAKLEKLPEGKAKEFALREFKKQEELFLFQKKFTQEQVQALHEGILAYNQGEADYKQGKALYEKGLQTFQSQSKQAQAEIDEQREKMKTADAGKFYFFDREDVLVGYREFYDDSDRIEAIGKVFPLIFFGVSILVTLSTVSRMIDESRMQIGVYKALGYSPLFSALKYLGFTFFAWLLGSVLGLYLGFFFIPHLIYDAYRIMYLTPDLQEGIVWAYAWVPLLLSFLASVGIAFFKSMSVSKTRTAELLRPAMPKGGQRIFLERIGFIWSRLGFLYKVSLRNLFRNKTRFFMTIAGIGGSLGLLITGFGLRHSIYSIVDLQFDALTQYDGLAIYEEGHQMDETFFEDVLNMNTKAIQVGKHDAYLYTAEDLNAFQGFIVLRDRMDHKEQSFSENDVAISEKLALLMDVQEGDVLSFTYNDRDYEVQIDKIVENYAYHYVYMPEKVHEDVFDKKPQANQMLFTFDEEKISKDDLVEKIYEDEKVLSLSFLDNMKETYRDMMGNFDIVIYVVVAAAIALEVVVLVNLITMNLSERYKEMATLKVLGFYPKELAAYLLRENLMLTLISLFFGSFFGRYLHRFVIVNAEIDAVMFNRSLKASHYLWAILFTVLVSVTVNLLMARKANNVNMSEALKTFDE